MNTNTVANPNTDADTNNANTNTNATRTPPSQADRPPGGTARTAGTRTPRRVQWASSDDVHVDSHPRGSIGAVGSSEQITEYFGNQELALELAGEAHALDELALDPNAFETLKDALERHRSSSSNLNANSNLEPDANARAQTDLATNANPDINSSNTNNLNDTSGNTNTNIVVPNPIYITPGTIMSAPNPQASLPPLTISIPPRARVRQGVASISMGEGNKVSLSQAQAPVQAQQQYSSPFISPTPTPTTATTSPTSSSAFLSPGVGRTHMVPGENYIDPDERAGLPMMGTSMAADDEGNLNPSGGFLTRSRTKTKSAGLALGLGLGRSGTKRGGCADKDVDGSGEAADLDTVEKGGGGNDVGVDADVNRRSTQTRTNGVGRQNDAYAAHEAGRVVRAHTARRWGWLYRPKSGEKASAERAKRREKRRAGVGVGVKSSDGGVGEEWVTADEKDKDNAKASDNHKWSPLDRNHEHAKPKSNSKPKSKHSWHAWHRPYSNAYTFSARHPHHSVPNGSSVQTSPDSDYDLESAPPPPTGVLSALLALYGHEHHDDLDADNRDGDGDGSVSGASTPARLSLSGDEMSGGGGGWMGRERRKIIGRMREKEKEKETSKEKEGGALWEGVAMGAGTGMVGGPWMGGTAGAEEKDSKPKANKHGSKEKDKDSGQKSRSLGRTLKSGSESASSLLSSLIPAHPTRSLPLPSIPHPSLHLPHPHFPTLQSNSSRPPKSTSSAGVLGPLIAGAGSLVGAAAPTQSTLAPNLTRPGYGLVRYSYAAEDGGKDTQGPQGSGQEHKHAHDHAHAHSPPTVHPPPRRVRSTQFDFGHDKLEEVSPERERDHDREHGSTPSTANESTSSPSATGPSPAASTTLSPSSTFDASNKASPQIGLQASARATGVNVPNAAGGTATTPGGSRKRWSGVLRDLPNPSAHFKGFSLSLPGTPYGVAKSGTGTGSTKGTPYSSTAELQGVGGVGSAGEMGENLKKDYFDLKWLERKQDEERARERRARKEKEKEREKEKRRKRKKAEVYITHHVAAILQRQEFILKLARAMMMFGGPSHRLTAQIQSTARVLDVELSCMYLPDVMLISFEDSATGTSNVKFIRQGSALDLGKLSDAHGLYWDVIHDRMSVSAASAALDALMHKKPLYTRPQLIIIGGMCSASICSVSFAGSFIDCLISAPLGALLVAVQLLSVRNELYGNVFEITIATLLSFLSAALASSHHFCYSAVASSSVVLILPGFIVLCGSLELSSRSLVAGAVRLCFALMYSLFLGFGLAIGAELYQTMLGEGVVGATDYTCRDSHDPEGPWWQQTPSLYWAFLTVPMYSFFLSLRNQAPVVRKEMFLLVVISCIGWVTNHFTSIKFPNQSDISAAVGAFAVGFVSNMYGRFFNGNAFVVMITGILFQLPSGLGNGGLLNFVSDQTSGSASSYSSGFQTALQLISVSIGLTVGLGISLVVVHPVQSRRRAGGLFSL